MIRNDTCHVCAWSWLKHHNKVYAVRSTDAPVCIYATWSVSPGHSILELIRLPPKHGPHWQPHKLRAGSSGTGDGFRGRGDSTPRRPARMERIQRGGHGALTTGGACQAMVYVAFRNRDSSRKSLSKFLVQLFSSYDQLVHAGE